MQSSRQKMTVIDQDDIRIIQSSTLPPIEMRLDGDLAIWEHPEIKNKYIVAIDSSAGVDPAAIQVINFSNGDQCAEYRGFTSNPLFQASLAVELAKEYNEAYLVVEVNGSGVVVLEECLDLGYKNIFYDHTSHPGWRTTSRNLALALENLTKLITSDNQTYIRSSRLVEELLMFFNESPSKAHVAYDDCTMAMVIAQAVRVGIQ